MNDGIINTVFVEYLVLNYKLFLSGSMASALLYFIRYIVVFPSLWSMCFQIEHYLTVPLAILVYFPKLISLHMVTIIIRE